MMKIRWLSNGLYSLKNCHKQFGQAFRPPPPFGQCPNLHGFFWVGLPLVKKGGGGGQAKKNVSFRGAGGGGGGKGPSELKYVSFYFFILYFPLRGGKKYGVFFVSEKRPIENFCIRKK